ncbi:MAG: 2,3-bisphosphoglycerate-independent phosphoglycerate mutase [Pseudomonadota bacterium]
MPNWTLKKNGFTPRPGPVVVVVMDGIGIGPANKGNAVYLAKTPVLDRIWSECPTIQLKAHGTAVGLPTDEDMGNSEVGHNALGAGRVFDQGSKLVDKAIANGTLFAGKVWCALIEQCKKNSAPLHFIGLLSDGNVHSHIDQLLTIIERCAAEGLTQVHVHTLLDGRDVPAQSALDYVDRLEALLAKINQGNGYNYRIVSGGGRMLVTMDRYEADWSVVERGWKAHVLGQGRQFVSAKEAIETYRKEDPKVGDQFLPEFVISKNGKPLGTIEDGHGVVFFNFRGDRALEITRAFEQENFTPFERQRWPQVLYAGMMQYDGDLGVPKNFLVSPPTIDHTFGEYLARNGIRQFACSETQKFGHVTYFWNGNRTGMFDAAYEQYLEVPSDRISFEKKPAMKAAEITDATIAALGKGEFKFARINYANGDMVGHTGFLDAAIIAVEAVDKNLGRLLEALEKMGAVTLVTADHGNADQMCEIDKKTGAIVIGEDGVPRTRTAHTLNPVPFSIVDPSFGGEYELDPSVHAPQLDNVAATALWLMGYKAPEGFSPPLIR